MSDVESRLEAMTQALLDTRLMLKGLIDIDKNAEQSLKTHRQLFIQTRNMLQSLREAVGTLLERVERLESRDV